MAHIAFCAPNGPGHVNPLLGPATELVRRGHRVTFAAPESFADRITETGAEHVPTPTTRRGQGEAPQMHGAAMIRAMGALLEEIKVVHADQVDQEAPDLVVHDATLAWWGRLPAHRWGVPAVENRPNLVSNKQWSPHHDHTRINPLNPRFLLTVFRMIGYARSQGCTDGACSCRAPTRRCAWSPCPRHSNTRVNPSPTPTCSSARPSPTAPSNRNGPRPPRTRSRWSRWAPPTTSAPSSTGRSSAPHKGAPGTWSCRSGGRGPRRPR